MLLRVPYTDLVGEKIRPAVIVSRDAFNRTSVDCVLLGITSVPRRSPYLVPLTRKDMEQGDLLRPSWVKLDAIHTVEQRKIFRRVGKLTPEAVAIVRERLISLF